MRDGWEIKTLEYGLKKDSSNLSINKLKNDEGDYPFYSAKGFVKKISFYHQEKSYLAIIKDGAGVGRVSLHPAKSSVVGTLQYLLPNQGFDIKFLYYYLLSVDFSKYFTGSTIPHIYFKDYKSEPFPILALKEQKEIVEILDQAFESIQKAKANIEKNIENSKELFQSKLNQILFQTGEGWEEKSIHSLCEVKGRIGYRGYTKGDLVNKGEGAITLSPSNIKNNTFNIDKCTYISWFKYDESPEIKVYDGDVLFVKTGSTYGKVAIVNELKEKATINPQFVIFKEIKCSNKFLFYNLITKNFKAKIESIVGGTATPTISQANLNKQTVNVPSLEKQEKIVEILDILDNHIQSLLISYEEELKNLEKLKKSILQKAFEGELTNKSVAV